MRLKTFSILPFISAVILLLAASCKKTEVNPIHGNTPPPDTAISTQLLESYVNRLYIILWGRKSSEAEFKATLKILTDAAGSKAAREQAVKSIMQSPEYHSNIVEIIRRDIIDGTTDPQIQRQIQQIKVLLDDPRYAQLREIIQQMIANLEALLTAKSDLADGKITVAELHKRFVNNFFYDEINMGTENFVVSTFQHFLDRYPGNVELQRAKDMVDGKSSQLFLKPGSSKTDYLNIFFSSEAYYEGQVIYLFQKYLYKKPNSEVMYKLAMKYKADNDYDALQTNLLTSDQFINP